MCKRSVKLFLTGCLFCLLLSGHAFAASISGVISCNVCSTTGGVIRVVAADGPDQCNASLVQETTMDLPGEYVLEGLPTGTELWLLAYWDADGNGTWNSGDYFGAYNNGASFTVSEEGGAGHDMDLSWRPEAVITATVMNVHEADGSFNTYLEAFIGEENFLACFPGDVESIVVEGPEGVMPYGKDDFTYASQWSEFYLIAPGSPAIGRYTISVTARGATATGSVTQGSLITIPIPDKDSFTIDDRTFSWDLAPLAGVPLYYRLEINYQGSRVYASQYVRDMNSHTVPAGLLTTGRTYAMRVRAADASAWDEVRNRANSEWVPFTWGGEISVMHVRRHTTEAGESGAHLFFMIKGSDNHYLASAEGVSSVRLYDPNDQEATLSSLVFSSFSVMMAADDGGMTDWSSSASFQSMSGFEADISDSLTPGAYRLEVVYNDQTFQRTFQFNGLESLPIVPSSSFRLTGEAGGAVTWSWEPPDALCPGSSGRIASVQTSTRAIIDIYKDALFQGELYVTVSTCQGALYLPSGFVQILNDMGDEFHLTIQLRTIDDNNRTYSNESVIDKIEADDPSGPFAEVAGRVVDAVTGSGVSGARIDFTPGEHQVIADDEGAFTAADIPPGTYSIGVSADGYTTKELPDVIVSAGMDNSLHPRLEPRAPVIQAVTSDKDSINNDGLTPTWLTAVVSHPDGLDHIASVTVDLSAFGGAASQEMAEDENQDGVVPGGKAYSIQVTATNATPIRSHVLTITAADDMGLTDFEAIPLSVVSKLSGAIQANQTDAQTLDNPLGRQTLTVAFSWNPSCAKKESGRNGDDCYVELTVYNPGGDVFNVYQIHDSLDITIEGAEAGAWRFETENKCDTPVNYRIETQGSGTGMIFGRVVDAYTGLGVLGASISCDTGGETQSLMNGYFSGVAVAGVGAVITIKSDYKVHTDAGVVIVAGGNTELDVQIIPESVAGRPAPTTAAATAVLDPSETPDPLNQPFAAKTSDGFLTLDALFPAWQQAMNLYLAMVIDYPGIADTVFLFAPDNAITDISKGLTAWREGVTAEQSARVLPPVPLSLLPPAVYTFASMAASTSGSPAGFDLIYYSITLGQAPPAGPVITHAESPLDSPDPVAQPLAAKISGENLVLDVYFPPQQEASTLYICYRAPGPSAAIQMLDSSDEWAPLSGALTPWRENIKTKQAQTVLNKPISEMAHGDYTFYSIITTDPIRFSNYNMVYFTKTIQTRNSK